MQVVIMSRTNSPAAPTTTDASFRPKLDKTAPACGACTRTFGLFQGRNHCMNCGRAFCSKHVAAQRVVLYHLGYGTPQTTCSDCYQTLMLAATSAGAVGAPTWKQGRECSVCAKPFGLFRARHHCRNCGESVCDAHARHRIPLYHLGLKRPVRTCDTCKSALVASARASFSGGRGRSPGGLLPASPVQQQQVDMPAPSAPEMVCPPSPPHVLPVAIEVAGGYAGGGAQVTKL